MELASMRFPARAVSSSSGATHLGAAQRGRALPLFVALHGLMGARRNWHSCAVALSTDPGATIGKAGALHPIDVLTVDVRNHGESPHASPHTLDTMADDIDRLIAAETAAVPDRPVILAGHSMGGVAAAYAVHRRATRRGANNVGVRALCLVDSAPAPRPSSFSTMGEKVKNLQREDFVGASSLADVRARVKAGLGSWGSPPMVQYFASNVVEAAPGVFRWRPDMPTLVDALENGHLLWERFVPSPPASVAAAPCRFVATHACFARDSPYFTDDAVAGTKAEFPLAVIDAVERGGHFHHVFDPPGYLRKLIPFLVGEQLLPPTTR